MDTNTVKSTKSKKQERRWLAREGAYRAAGEGCHGIHQGSNLYTVEAAQDRRNRLAPFVFRTWVEIFVNGAWKRIGKVEETTEEMAQGTTSDPTLA